MQAYICDVCHKQEAPDQSFQVHPPGWYSISKRNVKGPWLGVHVCSPVCLAMFADKQVAEPVAQPEAVHVG